MGTATCLPGLRPERGSEAGGGGRVPLTCGRGREVGWRAAHPCKGKIQGKGFLHCFSRVGCAFRFGCHFRTYRFPYMFVHAQLPQKQDLQRTNAKPKTPERDGCRCDVWHKIPKQKDNSGLLEVAASLGDLRFCRLHLVLQAPCSGLLNLSEGSHESCTVIPGKLSTPCFAATLKADHAEL